MANSETLQQYYERVPYANPKMLPVNNTGVGHFNVFLRSACYQRTPYSRRDFYKVSLILGTGKMHYADKWIHIDRPAILFSNPVIPYSWEPESELQEGWFCLFTEAFISNEQKGSLQDSPLFKVGSDHVFFVTPEQENDIAAIFKKMMAEMDSDYAHKYDLLRNYLHVIIHEAIKMQPADQFEKHANAAARTTALFLELLERQFPIDSPEHNLSLRSANDYAHTMSVHTNHLNRSVKQITGKTTSEHITARIIREAQALLLYTDWNISAIAYGLGFEEPAYFASFFKKHTGTTPGMARSRTV